MASNTSRNGTQRSAGEWQAILARFSGSGLSVAAFCRSEAISEASFYRWRSLLASVRQPALPQTTPPAPAFVDLGAVAASPTAGRLEIRLDLGAGLVLHLVRG